MANKKIEIREWQFEVRKLKEQKDVPKSLVASLKIEIKRLESKVKELTKQNDNVDDLLKKCMINSRPNNSSSNNNNSPPQRENGFERTKKLIM